MAGITFQQVTKQFGDGTVAVDALDLQINDGEFMIFVGPSGCGKTTALRMVAGLEHPTSGEILIGDKVVNDLDPVDRDIAMVFQNYALYPHMTVRENIGFPLRMQNVPKVERKQRIESAAELLGIGELLERKPGALSGGQRQRVAMGRAIVRHPTSFLMDEPLSNLDAKLRVQMRAELVKLAPAAGRDDAVRHPRPNRGDDARRARRRAQPRRDPAGGYARRALQPAGEHLRRDVHRQPCDELPSRPALGRRGRVRELPARVARAHRWPASTGPKARCCSASGPSTSSILVSSQPTRPADSLPVTVELTEQLGSETLLYFRADGVEAEQSSEGEVAARRRARRSPRPAHASRPGRAARTGHRHRSRTSLRPRDGRCTLSWSSLGGAQQERALAGLGVKGDAAAAS